MRPFERIVSAFALAVSLGTGIVAAAQIKNPIDKPVIPKTTDGLPPLLDFPDGSKDQYAAIVAFMDQYIGDIPNDWLTDPDQLKTDPERRKFVETLQADCKRMHLPQTPHVFILTPPLDKDGKPLASSGPYFASTVLPGGIDLIIIRSDVYGDKNALLTSEEMAAVLWHELKHIKLWNERGYMGTSPDLPSINFILSSGNQKLILERLKDAHQQSKDETTCDKNAVEYGDGKALYSAIIKINTLFRQEYEQGQLLLPPDKRVDFDAMMSKAAPLTGYPLNETRSAQIIYQIQAHDRKEHFKPLQVPWKPK